jgi:hypothetical protein
MKYGMVILVLGEWVLGFFFVGGLLMGWTGNFLLGTILGLQFLVLALVMILYILAVLPPGKVVEDRDEGLLW